MFTANVNRSFSITRPFKRFKMITSNINDNKKYFMDLFIMNYFLFLCSCISLNISRILKQGESSWTEHVRVLKVTSNDHWKKGDRMKNMMFLGLVVLLLTMLFLLHYGLHLISDTTLKISLLASLIIVLIARKKWKITFSTAE